MTLRPLLLIPLGLLAACSNGSSTASPTRPAAPVSPSVSGSATTGAGQSAVPAESNPPGDIPDNIAFVPYRNAAGHYSFTHPEGWAEATRTSTVTFTDKLNGVQAVVGDQSAPPTVPSARQKDVPALRQSQAAFELRGVTAVTLPAGGGVRIVYRRNSAPDPVTGRQYRDEVQRYEIVAGGHEVVMELYGPVGADNVDAYKKMIDSLKIA